MSSGISSPRRASESTTPRRSGRRSASRASRATTRNSSRFRKSRRQSATRDRSSSPTPTPLSRAPMTSTARRSRSRSAARLAAVQALYQQEMEGTPAARLLKEFHDHRLGATIEDAQYHDAEREFFDDIVTGVDARRADLIRLFSGKLAAGWTLRRLTLTSREVHRACSSL